MPARGALLEAGARLNRMVSVETIWSNEVLEARLAAGEPYDLIFPSDYLIERLSANGRLAPLARETLPLDRLADWSRGAVHDPGCRWSVPFAYGTTGYLTSWRAGNSWEALLDPPPGSRVGMLQEIREVVGAALLAVGHGPNDITTASLTEAGEALQAQRPRVLEYTSEDFVTPVAAGAVGAHQAWSGPAARAAREDPRLRYVVPEEGAVLWITAAAVPSSAPDPDASHALLIELMDPEAAARTTLEGGFATPNEAARSRLPDELRHDPSLFPDADTLARCHGLRDLGTAEARLAEVCPFTP